MDPLWILYGPMNPFGPTMDPLWTPMDPLSVVCRMVCRTCTTGGRTQAKRYLIPRINNTNVVGLEWD